MTVQWPTECVLSIFFVNSNSGAVITYSWLFLMYFEKRVAKARAKALSGTGGRAAQVGVNL